MKKILQIILTYKTYDSKIKKSNLKNFIHFVENNGVFISKKDISNDWYTFLK